MENCVDQQEEVLADGTKVRVMKMKDGSVMRKVVTETEGQKKLKEMKRMTQEGKGLAEEEAAVAHAERELKKKEENVKKLKEQRDKLAKKEVFAIPGGLIKGKVMRKNSKGEMVEVDIENEDFDENASVYEEVIDEHGNKTYKKVEKSKLAEINKYKKE